MADNVYSDASAPSIAESGDRVGYDTTSKVWRRIPPGNLRRNERCDQCDCLLLKPSPAVDITRPGSLRPNEAILWEEEGGDSTVRCSRLACNAVFLSESDIGSVNLVAEVPDAAVDAPEQAHAVLDDARAVGRLAEGTRADAVRAVRPRRLPTYPPSPGEQGDAGANHVDRDVLAPSDVGPIPRLTTDWRLVASAWENIERRARLLRNLAGLGGFEPSATDVRAAFVAELGSLAHALEGAFTVSWCEVPEAHDFDFTLYPPRPERLGAMPAATCSAEGSPSGGQTDGACCGRMAARGRGERCSDCPIPKVESEVLVTGNGSTAVYDGGVRS